MSNLGGWGWDYQDFHAMGLKGWKNLNWQRKEGKGTDVSVHTVVNHQYTPQKEWQAGKVWNMEICLNPSSFTSQLSDFEQIT